MGVTEDILEWSNTKLSPWKQDALRRLAGTNTFSEADEAEVLSLIKAKAGFTLPKKPPAPIPLTAAHLSSYSASGSLAIKRIQNIKNVNRLTPSAELSFCAPGLTIVYGRNGSGKSGFVRIFRTACRTRSDNPSKLKVLADVYGAFTGPQQAEIVAELDGAEVVIPWKSGGPASEPLLQVAVFDSDAAQLYVDGGSQVHFLPFGLALPHRLNELCLRLKAKLEAEQLPIHSQLAVAKVTFEVPRINKPQMFFDTLGAKTTDVQIDAGIQFSAESETRLSEISALLSASSASATDLAALVAWANGAVDECALLEEALSDENILAFQSKKRSAVEARNAANMNASDLFAGEPLTGVGSDTWRCLWISAKEYSVTEAYKDAEFPELGSAASPADCVLCQQPLSPSAVARMSRFRDFINGALADAANVAETELQDAIDDLTNLGCLSASDWEARLAQVGKRDTELASKLTAFREAVQTRREAALAVLETGLITPTGALASPKAELVSLIGKLTAEAAEFSKSDDAIQRQKLVEERNELIDQRLLSTNREQLVKRRDLLKEDALYVAALAEVQTKAITTKANELVDVHLTASVMAQYNAERTELEVAHLKVGLARKSGQTRATFQAVPGTSITKLSSEILSEGEQRALALASFLTEVGSNAGSAPIIIDDPVSSLDRERGLKVAARIAKEAKVRQVVVFTHDLIFFNDLCKEADEAGIPTETVALFSDGANSGKVDPAGVSWKGLAVAKRLKRIRDDFIPVKPLHETSPADYEFKVKNLYGRLRDAYERLVEEHIFCDVVRRGVDRIETLKLRLVHLTDALAIRFHDGMTKANTHSHDNPASATVKVPEPAEFEGDLAFIEQLIADLKAESAKAESNRPSMKPQKA